MFEISKISQLVWVAGTVLIGILIYIGTTYIFKVEECTETINGIKRKLKINGKN